MLPPAAAYHVSTLCLPITHTCCLLVPVLQTTRLDRLGRDTVNTQVCFPPATAAGRRRLSQAEPEALEPEALEPAQMLNPTIPAGAVWDDATQAKAVRGARYAAGIRCLPSKDSCVFYRVPALMLYHHHCKPNGHQGVSTSKSASTCMCTTLF